MALRSLPSIDWTAEFSGGTRPTMAASLPAWQQLLQVLQYSPDLAEVKTVVIANGIAVATSAKIRLDTEGGAASDVLQAIDLSSFEAGHRIMVSIVSAARTVTIDHRAGGSGQIDLAADADLVLSDPKQWVILERKGTKAAPGTEWEEVGSFALPSPGSLSYPIRQAVDFGGFGVTGARFITKTISAATYTLDIAAGTGDKTKKLLFTNASGCLFTLPASGVSAEDWVCWEQFGSGQVRFAAAAGAVIVSPLGHDRSIADGAMGELHVRALSPQVQWVLNGATASSAGSGTGGTGGGGTGFTRTVALSFASTPTTTSAGSTAYENVAGAALTHTPGDNETWLYFFNFVVTAGSDDFNNPGTVRAYHETAAAAVAEFGRGRYTGMREGAVVFHVRTYGTSNTAQVLRIQAKSGSTTSNVTVNAGAILGTKLEANEAGTFVATTSSTTSTTVFTSAATLTFTAAADDYLILVSADTGGANPTLFDTQVVIDGTPYRAKTHSRAGPSFGEISVVIPVALTAASHTIALQHKANTAGTSTLRNISIAAIRKEKFNSWFVATDAAEEPASTSTAYATKTTLPAAMASGWQYLALMSTDAWAAADASTSQCRTRLVRNGSQLGELLMSGTRLDAAWAPTGATQMLLIQQASAQDTFEGQWSAASATYAAKVKEMTLALLAIRQL